MRALIAYDGSAPAGRAVDLAAGVRWPPGSELRVLTVYAPFLSGYLEPDELFDPATPEAAFEDDRRAAEEIARSAVERLARSDLVVTWSAQRGRPASLIIDQSAEWHPDLLIAGHRGLGPLAAAFVGSVSDALVDHAPCPVLVVRRPTIERVLLAEDGSADALAAAQLLTWPIFAHSEARVVTVFEAEPHHLVARPTDAEPDARARLIERGIAAADAVAHSSAERLAAAGVGASVELRRGDAAHEITLAAEAWGADLIVMGTRGRTGLERLLRGSVAHRLLQHAPCSVLTVRAASSATAAARA